MDAQGFIVIGCCAVWCWSAVHVARRVWARHKPRRPGYLLGGSSRPTASTGMRAVGMRSQIGWVARRGITEECRLMSIPGYPWPQRGTHVIQPYQHLGSNSLCLTASGWKTASDGEETSGPVAALRVGWPKSVSDAEEVEALGCDPSISGFESRRTLSPMAELWGDFEWIDAA